MTAQPSEQPPTPEPPPVQVAPRKNSKLSQLHSLYADAKAARDAAEEQLKAITDGIKVELANAAPGVERVDLVSPAGPPLGLRLVVSWRFNSRKFKAEDPETWVRYASKGEVWTLKPLSLGGGE